MVLKLEPHERWIEIPFQFHSLYHDGPFTKCIDCESDLLNDSTPYFIERVFRGTEPICEMAMCLACRGKIGEELSRESMQKMKIFTEERFDQAMRAELTSQWDPSNIEPWIDHCALNKTPRSECRDYQLLAFCVGDRMVVDVLPLMVSGKAIEEMQRMLSKQTRERLGQVIDDYFGMPPEFADNPTSYSPALF